MKPTSRTLIPSLMIVAAIALTFQAARSRVIPSEPRATSAPQYEKQTASVSIISTDLALGREIDRLIDEGDLAQARWGLFVMSLNDGRVLYARNGDKLFTPASNMKIYTTAVALDQLEPAYRWRTSVYADKQPDASGTIEGDLILYGRGAPDLVSDDKGSTDSLARLADQLSQAGVRAVRGNVVGDESYFRGELFGMGWQWNDLQWYFGAQPSALTIDENSFEVTVAPASKIGSNASVVTKGDKGFVHLTNNTTTAGRDVATTIGINRGLSDNELRVWGEFPTGGRSFSAFLSVHNPALWAATLFRQALVARGIKIDGDARSRNFRAAENDKFEVQKAIELTHLDSKTLGEIVRKTNKESNNLFAELILRTLGKERGATAPDPDPKKNRERGDDEAGAAVVKSWLSNHSVPTTGLAIRDGSGLSRLDLVTPEATARLLYSINKTTVAPIFHDSLPIAGRDGTLSSRLHREAGRVVAKTGSLTYDHSLSGYASTQKGQILVFSIFCNDATGPGEPVHLIDQIVALLVAQGAK